MTETSGGEPAIAEVLTAINGGTSGTCRWPAKQA